MAKPPKALPSAFSLNGTNGADVLFATYGTMQAGEAQENKYNIAVYAGGGDDAIVRDRTGGYRYSEFSDSNSNGFLYGGGGFDVVSYASTDLGIVARFDAALSFGGPDIYRSVGTRLDLPGQGGLGFLGTDYLNGVEGLVGSKNDDLIVGGSAAERFWGHDGDDEIHGGGGADKLYGGAGDDEIHGDSGNDLIDGFNGDDELYGGSGKDTIYGGDGDDTIDGGHHADEIHGGDGNDVLHGGHGNDTIHVGDGVDTVHGGHGADTIHLSGFGNNTVDGGEWNDTVVFSTQAIVNLAMGISLRGTDGTDTLVSVENVTGSAYADGIVGTDGANIIKGGGGADGIVALGGADKVWGGGGGDTVYAGAGVDQVFGEGGDDTLFGGEDDDYIFGGSGKDRIAGGEGADHVYGGSNADTFVWNEGDYGLDRVGDFNVNEDKLAFGDGFLAAGAWKNNLFALNVTGLATTLYANTVDEGWEAIAVMDGVNATTLNQRIANGTIFDVQLNDEIPDMPGGFDFGGLDDGGAIQLGYIL